MGSVTGGPTKVEGTQDAGLHNGSSISQAIDMAAGTYYVNLSAAGYNSSLAVKIDGTTIYSPALGSAAYAPSSSPAFTVAAGVHTISVVSSGDYNFVDNISITASPSY
jgi:hypothetical protein